MQLPIFNEQFVIDRLLEAVCRLEYPLDKLEIQVLDDSTDETSRRSPATWWNNMPPRFSRHLSTTAPIATATRRARWPKD